MFNLICVIISLVTVVCFGGWINLILLLANYWFALEWLKKIGCKQPGCNGVVKKRNKTIHHSSTSSYTSLFNQCNECGVVVVTPKQRRENDVARARARHRI